ncbi:MAG: TIGR04295 family B12-binding domain-containing radical SAM protein [Alphaproteobacteria bacterium]|nr:TIGR04295 family B12-binding domain-containing radical SAM protein [Alphaproteobacteria bacterium]
MKIALVNPPWSFDGSIYFGCREPHLPLEFGYAQALLSAAGHEPAIFDAQAEGSDNSALSSRIEKFAPDMIVVTTAPSYLFWRCAPPELRVPQQTVASLGKIDAVMVAVGPHASSTPRIALKKLGVDAAVQGECEEVLVKLAETPRERWGDIAGLARWQDGDVVVQGGPQAVDMTRLPALRWPREVVQGHAHHHHRFDSTPRTPGAEMEVSRGCPYHCTFCAKDNFRDRYRRRPLATILDELDGLIAAGATYVYFIDEIFLPWRELLDAMVPRRIEFGIQTRIDLWRPDMLDLLGRGGCVSIEAGVESLTPEGRDWLDKDCKLSTAELRDRLIHAKRSVPFVQANLIMTENDDPEMIGRWREELQRHGVWANEPVPLFPYPGSPEYRRMWGLPDDDAWERALDYYLNRYATFSDIQEARPRRLGELELAAG